MTTSSISSVSFTQPTGYDEADSPRLPAIPQADRRGSKKLHLPHNEPHRNIPRAASSGTRDTAQQQPAVHGTSAPSVGELETLLARYDTGAGNASRDAHNAELGAKLEELALTGYPSDVRSFERRVQTDLGLLAQLPPDRHDLHASALARLWTGFEATSDEWGRGAFAHEARNLHDTIVKEHDEALNDPAARAEALFNTPYGSDFPSADGQQLLSALNGLHAEFNEASTSTQREAALKRGAATKQQLQQAISASIDKVTQSETQASNSARTDVLNALDYAAAITGPGATPAARLAALGNQVFGDAVHARAFTELRQNEPERFTQLMQWENELAEQDRDAAQSVPEVSLAPPKNYSDIRYNLPAPGPEYESDLRQRYVGALHSIVEAEKRIHIAHQSISSPIRQNYIRTHSSST